MDYRSCWKSRGLGARDQFFARERERKGAKEDSG